MIRRRVYVTRRGLPAVEAELARSFDVGVHDLEFAPPRDELLAEVAGAEGLLTVLADRVDAELMDATGPQLRIVANYAVGYENVDLGAAAARGVAIANTPDVLTEATAELAITLALALVRRVAEGDRLLRRHGRWTWSPGFMLGESLRGKTLGIVGYGRIGREVGRLAGCLGMRVIHAGRGDALADLLANADVVSLHVPLNDETRHLIDRAALGLMRPGAVLVNTSRGPVVDEAALVTALRGGQLAGAALDVYEREPEVSEELLRMENVVLAPHLGSATTETRTAMGMLCVEALRAVLLEGRPPDTLV